jgi:hypothetical protein
MYCRSILHPSVLTPMLDMEVPARSEPTLQRVRSSYSTFRSWAEGIPLPSNRKPKSRQEIEFGVFQSIPLPVKNLSHSNQETQKRNIIHLTKGGFRPKSCPLPNTIEKSHSYAPITDTHIIDDIAGHRSRSRHAQHDLLQERKPIRDIPDPVPAHPRLGLAGKKLPHFRNTRVIRSVLSLRNQTAALPPEWIRRSPSPQHGSTREHSRPAYPRLLAVPTPASPPATAPAALGPGPPPHRHVIVAAHHHSASDPRSTRVVSPGPAAPPADPARSAPGPAHSAPGPPPPDFAAARPATVAALTLLLAGGISPPGPRAEPWPDGPAADAPAEPHLPYVRMRHADAVDSGPTAAAAAEPELPADATPRPANDSESAVGECAGAE